MLYLWQISPVAAQFNITNLEYFYDNDPGLGNGTIITIFSPADSIGTTISISPPASQGFHTLCIRTKNSSGRWSMTETRGFYVYPPITNSSFQVTALEYFFDYDPGLGNASPIAVSSPSDSISQLLTVNLSSLSQGFHTLCIRSRNALGKWSMTETRGFYVHPASSSSSLEIASMEYFFDTDPGVGKGISISVPSPADSIVQSPMISTIPLPTGAHKIGIRTRNRMGAWSLNEVRDFNIFSCSNIYDSIIALTSPSFCQGGQVVLSSYKNSNPSWKYRWYRTGSLSLQDTLFSLIASSSGSYRMVVTDSLGCSDTTNSITVSIHPSYDLTIYDTICAGDSIIWNGTYLKTGGRFVNSFLTVKGCDSIRTLYLEVLPDYHVTNSVTITSYQAYRWKGKFISQAGSFVDTLKSVQGCDSSLKLILTVQSAAKVPPIKQDSILISTISSGDSYTWMDCDSKQIVSTSSSFKPTKKGNYRVLVKKGNIIDTSDCIKVDTIYGVGSGGGSSLATAANPYFSIYPNPSSFIIHIDISQYPRTQNCIWTLVDNLGREIHRQLIDQKETKINTTQLPVGIYHSTISMDGYVVDRRKITLIR
jgi:hypothetical protein